MLCDNLEVRDGVGGGREMQERGKVHIPMADSCYIQQKLAQYCKASILQLKINKYFFKRENIKSRKDKNNAMKYIYLINEKKSPMLWLDGLFSRLSVWGLLMPSSSPVLQPLARNASHEK